MPKNGLSLYKNIFGLQLREIWQFQRSFKLIIHQMPRVLPTLTKDWLCAFKRLKRNKPVFQAHVLIEQSLLLTAERFRRTFTGTNNGNCRAIASRTQRKFTMSCRKNYLWNFQLRQICPQHRCISWLMLSKTKNCSKVEFKFASLSCS